MTVKFGFNRFVGFLTFQGSQDARNEGRTGRRIRKRLGLREVAEGPGPEIETADDRVREEEAKNPGD